MKTYLTPALAERLPLIADLRREPGPPSQATMAARDAFHAPFDGYEIPEVDVVDTSAPGPHGDVPVRVYRHPERTATRGLTWIHGGAFRFGDLDMPESDIVARELAARTDVVVVAVDYRLCLDGVHFPVPHDDVYAAYRWAVAESGLLDKGAVWVIGGGSAGGNLAAGVAQRLRDEKQLAGGLVLAYPVMHDVIPKPTAELATRLATLPPILTFTEQVSSEINANYLGSNPADVPYAFPGLGDVDGLPPTFISLGELDSLTPSGESFVQQLTDAGVPVRVERVPGVPHGHLNIVGLDEALATIEAMAEFVNGLPT